MNASGLVAPSSRACDTCPNKSSIKVDRRDGALERSQEGVFPAGDPSNGAQALRAALVAQDDNTGQARLGRVNVLLRDFRRVCREGKRENWYSMDILEGDGHVSSFHGGDGLGLGSRGDGVYHGCSSVGNVR